MNYLKRFCLVLITVAIAAKFYGLTDPWKTHDHYNFGGVWTTTYAECLKQTPLAVSKGIPHVKCWEPQPSYYQAHPPSILFAMWGWTSIFGSSEASYRSFILLFSSLNVLLVFLIARRAEPESELFPYLAAVFQSGFLGGIYFGTHPDFIGEFTVFFVLLSALFALRRWLTWAAVFALLAGISAWPGYIAFAPLWLYTIRIGFGRKRVFALGALGILIALGTMMWLHQTFDIVQFLHHKILDPGYISKREKGWLEPIFLVENVIKSLARLLSPLLASWALSGAAFLLVQSKSKDFQSAVWLSGGTGLVYLLIGHEYFMVHVFLYLLLIPGLALLTARFAEALLQPMAFTLQQKIVATILVLLLTSFYPYGIYQSNRIHDALNSAAFILASLAGIVWLWKSAHGPEQRRRKVVTALIAISVLTNISQMINYRNEPDTERSFCEKARQEYQQTGQPVVTDAEESSAKDFLYCRGIPMVYKNHGIPDSGLATPDAGPVLKH